MTFTPNVDDYLIVQLPGERVRAVVREIVKKDKDAVLVELVSAPMAKGHSYQKGDIVAARRRKDTFGQDEWAAVNDRSPPRKETRHAIDARIEPSRRFGKHPGVGKVGPTAETKRRDSLERGKKAPKGKRRSSA